MTSGVVVAGLGSEYRQDDGAGPAVARRIAEMVDYITDVGPMGEPLDLLGRWDEADLAIVIDSMRSGAELGAVEVFDLSEADLERDLVGTTTVSTHGIGFIGTLRLSRALDRAPSRVLLVAIEGRHFDQGMGLSEAVQNGVDQAVERIVDLLGDGRTDV